MDVDKNQKNKTFVDAQEECGRQVESIPIARLIVDNLTPMKEESLLISDDDGKLAETGKERKKRLSRSELRRRRIAEALAKGEKVLSRSERRLAWAAKFPNLAPSKAGSSGNQDARKKQGEIGTPKADPTEASRKRGREHLTPEDAGGEKKKKTRMQEGEIPNVFGMQPSMQGGNAPHSLNTDKQPEQTDAQGLLGVINQLQEFLQEKNENATQDKNPPEFSLDEDIYAEPQEFERTDPPLTIPEKTAVDNDSPQEGVLSSIIEQLQNFIHSANQTQENAEREISPKDVLKNQSVSDERNMSEENRARSSSHFPEQSQQKRVADSTTDAPQQKQPRIETTNNNPSTTSSKLPELKVKNPENVIKPSTSQGASKTQAANLIKQPDIIPEVSILGDSLLQRARSQFGGSRSKDCRENHFTMQGLLNEVMNFYSEGQRLNHFCVLMCGVNDMFSDISLVALNQTLKRLLNFLSGKGHYVFLVTFPNVISSVAEINRKAIDMNGFLASYHSKPNLSVIRFHKKFLQCENRKSLFYSIREKSSISFTVLSDIACKLIREMIEKTRDLKMLELVNTPNRHDF